MFIGSAFPPKPAYPYGAGVVIGLTSNVICPLLYNILPSTVTAQRRTVRSTVVDLYPHFLAMNDKFPIGLKPQLHLPVANCEHGDLAILLQVAGVSTTTV
jgi:hypothetical protein